ncbi:MAG: DUF6719 family protein [Hyphomicrobiaceae bacterium]
MKLVSTFAAVVCSLTLVNTDVAVAGRCIVLNSEPLLRTIRTGIRVYVDNGSCRSGQILELRGGTRRTPRHRDCVNKRAMLRSSRFCSSKWRISSK